MIDVLIPFYADVERRQRIWDFNRGLWTSLPRVRVLVGEDRLVVAGRPFSPARARNAAARMGNSEWLLAYDADAVPPGPGVLAETVERATRGPGWATMFAGTRVLKVTSTDAFIEGKAELLQLRLMTRIPSAIGPIVVSRELFERANGYDERFEGWGFEDTALRRVLLVMAGMPDQPPKGQDCWALSPRTPDLIAQYRDNLRNRELYEREYSWLGPDDLDGLFQLRRTAAINDSPARV